uniref:Uncharacterized protein n=1 Tax=Aegilops tauschii TaxID=37682 RepID=R7WEF0_AEGTA
MAEPCVVSSFPSTLVGNALYWWLKKCQHEDDGILKFDLDSQTLSVIKRPIFNHIPSCSIRIIRGEHGGVGLAVCWYPRFQIWERMVNSHGTAIWVLRKTARMHSMLQYAMLTIVGYSEDGDALLLTVSFGGGVAAYSFMLQLESMEWTNLNQSFLEYSYHPFAYFYTAVMARAIITNEVGCHSLAYLHLLFRTTISSLVKLPNACHWALATAGPARQLGAPSHGGRMI